MEVIYVRPRSRRRKYIRESTEFGRMLSKCWKKNYFHVVNAYHKVMKHKWMDSHCVNRYYHKKGVYEKKIYSPKTIDFSVLRFVVELLSQNLFHISFKKMNLERMYKIIWQTMHPNSFKFFPFNLCFPHYMFYKIHQIWRRIRNIMV